MGFNELDKLRLKLIEITYTFKNHQHCKECNKVINGIVYGETTLDLDSRNPLFKFRLCVECGTKIVEKNQEEK